MSFTTIMIAACFGIGAVITFGAAYLLTALKADRELLLKIESTAEPAERQPGG